MTAPNTVPSPDFSGRPDLEAEVAQQVGAWRARIAGLPGIHKAIEVLWDAGQTGWCLNINLVTAGRAAGGDLIHFGQSIATLRYDAGLSQRDGAAVVWPEAAVAGLAGVKIAGDLGIDFYFPSPEHADNDCPHWWERESARPCRLCGKLLIRHGAVPGLAAPCFPCRLEEQVQRPLIADALGAAKDRIGYVVLLADDRPVRRLTFNLGSSRGGALARLAALLLRRRPPVALSADIDATLAPAEVASMRDWCREAIESHLGHDGSAEPPDQLDRPHTFTWCGQQQTVPSFLNPGGEEIDTLLDYHAHFTACAAGGGSVLLFGNGGVTHRDVRFLRYLGVRGGACTLADLCAAYPFLDPEVIETTVAKLGRRRFMSRDGQDLRLLPKGMVVDIAGP